jgi:hypothetical protein
LSKPPLLLNTDLLAAHALNNLFCKRVVHQYYSIVIICVII